MTFFPLSPTIVSIEATSTSFKIVHLKKKKKIWVISSLEEIPLANGLKGKIPKNALVVTSLPSEEILVRQLDLPLKKEKDIEAAYPFQAETLIPYPLEKASLQRITLKAQQEGTLLTILAAKKEHVQRHVHYFKQHQISPCIVTSISVGLAFLSTFFGGEEAKLVLHMGEKEGTLALVEGGKLLTARAFEIEREEIQKSVLSILNAYKSKKIETIFLLSSLPSHRTLIEEATGKAVVIPKIPHVSEEAFQKYSSSIVQGLAATQKNCCNFLSPEEKYICSLKKAKLPLFAFFTLAAVLFTTFSLIENKILKEEEQALLKRSSSLFTSPPSSIDELAQKLELKDQEIDKWPDTFPLWPQVPKVSEILASLSKDPLLKDESGTPLIEIEDFRYYMVSRPSFEQKSDHYQVKVELVFQSSSSNAANHFHESLPSYPFVDAKKEIEWSAGKGKYRATFFLKDRTRYS